MTWWESTAAVERVAGWANWAVAVFGLMAAAAGVCAIVLASRASALKALSDERRAIEAADLRGRVANAEGLLGDAQRKQTTAEQKLADLEARSAAISKQADDALKRAEAQSPRTLNSEQQARLVKILRGGPKGEINLQMPIAAGGEAQGLSALLEKCLLDAGWTIPDRAVIPFSDQATGVFLVVKSAAAAPARAGWLQGALQQVGIVAQGAEEPALGVDQVDVIVARKP